MAVTSAEIVSGLRKGGRELVKHPSVLAYARALGMGWNVGQDLWYEALAAAGGEASRVLAMARGLRKHGDGLTDPEVLDVPEFLMKRGK